MPGRGERHACAKIKEGDVRAIRARRRRGETVDSLFLEFGPKLRISHSQITKICAGYVWKHVEP